MTSFFVITFSLFTISLSYGQKRTIKFDILTGLNKPLGSLDFANNFGWRIGGGIRYRLKNKSSINILQLNYDAFTKRVVFDVPYQKENDKLSKTLSILTGYSCQIFNKVYIGGNAGVGFVGHNKNDRVTKFGINPLISYEPFREVFVDFSYLNFLGGFRSTNYLNFNLRYSF